MAVNDLPPGFVLDTPAAPAASAGVPDPSGLPPGFVLDNPGGGSSVGGVAKSLGTGLAEGAIGLAGLPADLAHMYAPNQSDANPLGSAGLQKAVETKTGEFYKPQGVAEDIASKIGQFAPAVIGGPETLAAKVATRVVAPAVASEAAGKATEGTAAQPYAEIAGALAGGAGASMMANKLRALSAARGAAEVPSVTDLKAAARAQYQHPDVQAVQIRPDVVAGLADTISSDLQHGQNSGFRAANEPKVFGAVDELKTAAAEGRPATVADLDNVRQVLGNAAKERDVTGSLTRQAVAANRAIDHIDNFLPNLQQPDLIAGDAAKANSILDTARQNWGAAKRAEQVQTIAKNAEINAASSNSGGNIQNATKQAFKPLLKNNYQKAGGYTDLEKQALNKIVRGTWTGTAARAAGNLLGGGGGLGMLAGGAAGYEEGGIPGAIAVGLAGRGLKYIGNRSTLNAVKNLDMLLRSRAPAALKAAAQDPKIVQLLPSDSVKTLRSMILATPEAAPSRSAMVPPAQVSPASAPPILTRPPAPRSVQGAPVIAPQPAPFFAPPVLPVESARPANMRPATVPEKTQLPEYIRSGPAHAKTTPLSGKSLFHETSAENAAAMLADDLTNSTDRIRSSNIFLADNPDIAIGQGGSGIRIEYNGDLVSGAEHRKPGTGDLSGREYQANAIGNNAIKSILVAPGEKLPLKPAWQARFDATFDRATESDGSTLYVRKKSGNQERQPVGQPRP